MKNWCFWTVVLEKTLESPLSCKEIQLVNPKGNQSWIFIERTDAESEVPTLWLPDVKTDSLEKTLMLERLKAGGEGDIRGWSGILTWWTCVWASSGSWWWIGKTVMLQSMGSQRVGQDWATKLKLNCYFSSPVLMVCFAFMVVFDSLRKLNYYLLLFWNC